MLGWGAVDGTMFLAPKYQGYLLAAQCYELYFHAATLIHVL